MKRERAGYYNIIKVVNTDIEYVSDCIILETVETTWTEFLKHARQHYNVLASNKRRGYVYVK